MTRLSFRRGLSLAEVVFAILILSASIIPVYNLFSASGGMNKKAKGLARAMSLATSVCTALTSIPKNEILAIDGELGSLSAPYLPNQLLPYPIPDGYKIQLKIEALPDHFYLLQTTVHYDTSGSYSLQTLRKGP